MGERLTVGEICTRSVTIAFRSTPLNGAARLMRENHVGSLVVVEETGGMRVVVGILTDRDIVTAVVAADLEPATLRTEDVMSTDLITAREDDSLIDLVRSMRRKGVRRVPVVGAQGELVGAEAFDEVDAQGAQLVAHGWVDARITPGDPVTRLPRQRRQPAHERTANTQNMNVHRRILGAAPRPARHMAGSRAQWRHAWDPR